MKQKIPGQPMPGHNIYPKPSPEKLHQNYVKKKKKFEEIVKKKTSDKIPNWAIPNDYAKFLPHIDRNWTEPKPNPDVAPWWKEINEINKKNLEIIKQGANKKP